MINVEELIEYSEASRMTVFRTLKRIREQSSLAHALVSGRPRLLDETDRRRIAQWFCHHPHLSASEISARLRPWGTNASEKVVRNELKNMGYRCAWPPRGPMIKDEHKHRRVQWCLEQEEANVNWDTVVFSDECKIALHRNTLKVLRKRDSRRKRPIPSHSPRVGVWSAFSSRGLFPIVFYEGSLNTDSYCGVLNEDLLATADILYPDGYSFIQDNAPCHSANTTTAWLQGHNVNTLPWPLISPDLNPIENVWSILKVRVEKRQPKTKAELKTAIEEEWHMIGDATMQNLVTSMVKHLRLCIFSHGNSVKYWSNWAVTSTMVWFRPYDLIWWVISHALINVLV